MAIIAPDFDTGLAVAIPSGAPVAPSGGASVRFLLAATLRNTDATNAITVTITDTAGNELIKPVNIPPDGDVDREWPFKPTTGVKWGASAAGAVGQLWGYNAWPF